MIGGGGLGFEVVIIGLEFSFVMVVLCIGGSIFLIMCVIGVICSGVVGGSGDFLIVGGVIIGVVVVVVMLVCVVEK